MSIKDEFAGLDMGSLLGGPLLTAYRFHGEIY